MRYNNIRQSLINTINEIEKEIYALSEGSQDQIFNSDIIPEEPGLLFLKNSYCRTNEMLSNLNML